MRYRVAIDRNRGTKRAWMDAAGQQGIPCAFIVKDGRIEWIGHPLMGLDVRVAELAGDEAYASQCREVGRHRTKFMTALQGGRWKEASKACAALLEHDPDDLSLRMTQYQLLAARLKKSKQAGRIGREIVEGADEPGSLNEFAWGILTDPAYEGARDLKLATAAAKKAVALCGEKDAAVLDTYARALWDGGDREGAIEWQKKAVKLGTGNPKMDAEIGKTLKAYERKMKSGRAGKGDDDDDEEAGDDVDDKEDDDDD
jgi:tetratricopeptide (TPR) repeat protein